MSVTDKNVDTGVENERVRAGVLKEQLQALDSVQQKHNDWLKGQESSSRNQTTLDLLTTLYQVQVKEEECVSEITSRISEARESAKLLLSRMKTDELKNQINELKERREKAKGLLSAVKASKSELTKVMDNRKVLLRENKERNQLSEKPVDSRIDNDSDLKNYLQKKFDLKVFDEDKVQRGLEKLNFLDEKRVAQEKRLINPAGISALPKIPIPQNEFVARDEFQIRRNYLEELKVKVEDLTTRPL